MKPGRNDLCPCGSGKKYKQCCYLNEGLLENIFEDLEDEEDLAMEEFLVRGLANLHNYVLRENPHIKEYNKIRKLHSEVVNAMADYYYEGKFKQQIDPNYPVIPDNRKEVVLEFQAYDFNLNSEIGSKAFYDMIMYKPAPNINCITEDFINQHKYRKPEKVEFLQSMLNSRLGLFEIAKIEADEGYVHLKEIFTGDEYKITDIGLSGTADKDKFYIYTRIITYHGVSFGTGLNMVFAKDDKFIRKHIRQYKKNYSPDGEMNRFMQIYNQYSKDQGGIKAIMAEWQ